MVGTRTCSARHSFTELCPGEAPGMLGAFNLRPPSCSELSIANPLPRPYLTWPAYLPNSTCSPHPHLCPSHPGLPVLTDMQLPSQGFVPALPSAVITSPLGVTPLSFGPLLKRHPQQRVPLTPLAEGTAPSLCPWLHLSSRHFGTS